MSTKIVLEVDESKAEQLLNDLKSHPFVERATIADATEITNPRILQSIEDYESGKIKPTIIGIDDLKALLNA